MAAAAGSGVPLAAAMTERRPNYTPAMSLSSTVWSEGLVTGSWTMPRLPVNIPRCEMATILAEGCDAVSEDAFPHCPNP